MDKKNGRPIREKTEQQEQEMTPDDFRRILFSSIQEYWEQQNINSTEQDFYEDYIYIQEEGETWEDNPPLIDIDVYVSDHPAFDDVGTSTIATDGYGDSYIAVEKQGDDKFVARLTEKATFFVQFEDGNITNLIISGGAPLTTEFGKKIMAQIQQHKWKDFITTMQNKRRRARRKTNVTVSYSS